MGVSVRLSSEVRRLHFAVVRTDQGQTLHERRHLISVIAHPARWNTYCLHGDWGCVPSDERRRDRTDGHAVLQNH